MFKTFSQKIICFLWIICIGFLPIFYANSSAVETITNIILDPTLDISRFSSYKAKATISGSPTSVSAVIYGVNGQDSNYWNYYVSGVGNSESRTKTMSKVGDTWETTSIYPDDIYPEIYFAPSDITWNNVPANTTVWRGNYHLLKFQNPFTPASDMNLWFEFNATPVNPNNSNDLQVYIVEKDVPLSYFQSDWRNKAQTELVATFTRSSALNHTHTGNSSHRLVTLSTNIDGTIGTKSLDVSSNFWVVIYQDANNSSRGWNLRYHSSSLCQNSSNWYQANRSGGNTWNIPVYQNGCPDAHVHLARRSGSYVDGAKAVITATYDGGSTVTQEQIFSFGALPNLPPNQTAFTSPVASSIYDGGSGEIKLLPVSWNPASDVNDDTVYYSIVWLDQNGDDFAPKRILETNIEATSFNWDISAVDDAAYKLYGYACDTLWDETKDSTWLTAHCSTFDLTSSFTIDKVDPVYSLSNIALTSNNANTSYAKVGDTVTLNFTASGVVAPTVVFYSGGDAVTNAHSHSNVGNDWTYQYVVHADDTDGFISFDISASNLDALYTVTNDDSHVIAQVTGPGSVVASPVAGTFSAAQSVSLSSTLSSQIRYTTDSSNPTCSSGTVYSSALTVSIPTTIKAIACDQAGNTSSVGTFAYAFQYTLDYTAGAGGTITGTASQTVNHGSDGSEVTATPNAGYHFVNWSDDVLTAARTDTNITSNQSLTANFAINTYTLSYSAGAGGTITGTASQTVNHGSDGSEVTATPNYNYQFVRWSDNSTTNPRTDLNITANLTVSAVFEYVPPRVGGSVHNQVNNLQALGKNTDAENLKQLYPHLFLTNANQPLLDQYLNQLAILQKQLAQLQNQSNISPNNESLCSKITSNLYFGLMNNSEVKCLQQFLKNQGSDVNFTGPISGNFLSLTKQSVIRFQEKYANDILSPIGRKQGTGYVGSLTKTKINQLLSN